MVEENKNEFNLCEMIKFNISDVKEEVDVDGKGKKFTIPIFEDKLEKKTTLIRESEIIRIVKALNSENINLRKDKNGNDCDFPFIKDLFSLKVSIQKYEKNQLGLITVLYQKKHLDKIIITKKVIFKRLLASTSNIRNKKVIYIRENLFEKANNILLGGMPVDMQHKQFSKYSAYYALASTDSTPVTKPNVVVIDDLKNEIIGICDLVIEEEMKGKVVLHKKTGKPLIDKKTGESKREKDIMKYDVKNNEKYTLKGNKPFDGAGLADISLAEIWAKELGLDYVPSAFQFRAIPGIKGNLYVFDFEKFATEFQDDISRDEGGQIIVKDACRLKNGEI